MDQLGIVVLGACAVWGLSSIVARRRPRGGAGLTVYVHLAWSGRIFVIRGETGEETWVDRPGLIGELERVAASGGGILYSRERPTEDPPAVVMENFRVLADYQLPMRLVDEPHEAARRHQGTEARRG